MQNKPSGFITKFRFLGTLRAMVAANGHCEDFMVSDECDRDMNRLWEETLEKSEMLSGLKLSHSIDDMDETIQFVVEGYNDAQVELVANLRDTVGSLSAFLDSAHKGMLDVEVGSVNVAFECADIATELRSAAVKLDKIAKTVPQATDSEVTKKVDVFAEGHWCDDGGSVGVIADDCVVS